MFTVFSYLRSEFVLHHTHTTCITINAGSLFDAGLYLTPGLTELQKNKRRGLQIEKLRFESITYSHMGIATDDTEKVLNLELQFRDPKK